MSESAPASTPHWTRLRRFLVAAAVVLAGLAILLATGLPQRALLDAVLTAALGARVEVGSVSTLGAIEISRLALYERGDEQALPAVLLENLVLDYRLISKNGRHVPTLTVDRLDVDAEKTRRMIPKKEREARPSRFDAESFAPERIEIRSLNLKSTAPSYSFAAEGLAFQAAIESVRDFQVEIQGENVTVSLWTRANDWSREVAGGRMNLSLAVDESGVALRPMEVSLPGLLELEGSAGFDGRQVAVSVDKMVAQEVDFSKVDPADLPVPFAFQRLDLSGSHIKGEVLVSAFSLSVPETLVKLTADDLVLGPQGAEYYQGDLEVEVTGVAGAQADYALTATLNRGQKVTASFTGHHLAFSGHAGLKGWSREDVLEALPANMRGGVSYLWLLERIDAASVDFEWKMPALTAKGAVDALFVVKGEERPGRLEFAGEGPVAPEDRRAFEMTAKATLAGGEITVASMLADIPAQTTLTLREIDPALWLYTLTERDMLDDLHARLSGAVTIKPAGAPQQLRALVDLQAAPFGYGPVKLPEGETLNIAGELEADTGPFGYVRGKELVFRINEDSELALRDWNFPMQDFGLTGDVQLRLDLAILETVLPGSDIRGHLAMEGPLANDRGYMDLDVKGSIENLGYGDYAAPYGVPIETTGTFSFDNLNGRLTGRNFKFNLPEATSLASDGWTFEGSTAQFTMPFTLTTDFKPLQPMGLLDQVQGGAGTVKGTLAYGSAGAKMDAEFDASADTLVVGGERAGLTGVTASGKLASEPGGPIRGEGRVKAAKLAAMGAVFEQIEGPVTLEGGRVRAPELNGSLYGGTARVAAEAGLLEENLPVKLDARVQDVDLGLFTEPLGVPAVRMTGLASGEAAMAYDYATGIRALEADLNSSRGFTVNVYLLERLLAMQFARQYAGRQMEKIKAKIIGQEEQRPFDSGRLVLNYQGERIGGQASLKSKELDLTVDLQMDTEAFFSALKLAQEARIERLGIAPEEN